MKGTRGSRWLGAFALALAAFAAAVPARAQQSRRRPTQASSRDDRQRIDTTFAFDKSGSVNVDASSGEIAVTGWSRDEVHVRATSDGGTLRLDASSSRMTLGPASGRGSSDTRYEISVPYGVRVLATSRSGDVSVRGTRGQVEIHSQNGDVDVDDVAGHLDIKTLSGDLTAGNINGDVEISTLNGEVKLTTVRGNIDVGTVSGEIQLRGITSKLVRAKATSADITFDGSIDPNGRYELSTHSGDIRLHIPRDASAQLSIATWSGGVNSDFPITLRPGEHGIGLTTSKQLGFQIGGGAARITAETFSGDVTISANGRGASERR